MITEDLDSEAREKILNLPRSVGSRNNDNPSNNLRVDIKGINEKTKRLKNISKELKVSRGEVESS